MTIKEIRELWYENNPCNTEAELLRQTVLFINRRAEYHNDGKSVQILINDYLRFWNDN